MTVDTPIATVHRTRTRNQRFQFNTLTMNSLQKLQVEKIRLTFLLRMRARKRPPPSLRCNGMKALDEPVRIAMISKVETTALCEAIKRKKKDILLMEKSINMLDHNVFPLSGHQKKKWKKHFNQKLAFYREQEVTVWKLWPSKSEKYQTDQKKQKRKMSRALRNARKKRKLIEKRAQYHLEA